MRQIQPHQQVMTETSRKTKTHRHSQTRLTASHSLLHLSNEERLHVRQEANTLQQQPDQHSPQSSRTTETHLHDSQGIRRSANALKDRVWALTFTATAQPSNRTAKRNLQLRNLPSLQRRSRGLSRPNHTGSFVTINQHGFPAGTSCSRRYHRGDPKLRRSHASAGNQPLLTPGHHIPASFTITHKLESCEYKEARTPTV